jgi:thioredoxin
MVAASLGLVLCGCEPRLSPELRETASKAIQNSAVTSVTDATFETEVLQSDQPVLVDLWAGWCPPCIAMKPALAEVSNTLKDELKVVEVNVDENPFLANKYQADALPKLVVIVDGEVAEQAIGRRSASELLELVRPYL